MDHIFESVSDTALRNAEQPIPYGTVVQLRPRHLHRWQVEAMEHDRFGTVRMRRCFCGAEHFDDRAVAG